MLRFACAWGFLLVPAVVAAQTMDWQVVAADGHAQGLALARGVVVAVGVHEPGGGGVSELVVQARRRATGEVVWEDRGLAGCCAPGIVVGAVPDTVVVAGQVTDGMFGGDIAVRAYDAATGAVLWTDIFPPGNTVDVPTSLVVTPTVAVVAGRGGVTALGNGLDGLVRAYRLGTGEVLWETVTSRGNLSVGSGPVDERRGRVVVATGLSTNSGPNDFLLQAHDDETGVVAWEVARVGVNAVRMEVKGGRVVVVGSQTDGQVSRPYAGVFRLKTGAVMWEHLGSGPGGYQGLAVHDGRVVVAGNAGMPGPVHVRAFDAGTGVLLWDGTAAPQPGEAEAVGAVEAVEDRLFLVGGRRVPGPGVFGDREVIVRAYRLADGGLEWEDRSDRGPEVFNGTPFLTTGGVDVLGGPRRIFVAATVRTGPVSSVVVLRAYVRDGPEDDEED